MSDASPPAAPQRAPAHTDQTAGGASLVETAFIQKRKQQSDEDDVFDAANFAQVRNNWLLDRLMPGGVVAYFAVAIAICTGVWILGLVLRIIERGGDWLVIVESFLRSREWQLQPLLLFVHLLCLRLFKSIYGRHFDGAFKHVAVPREKLEAASRWFFGFRANFGALAIAAPFMAYRAFVYFPSDRLLTDYDLASRGGEAGLLLVLWLIEWLMFGYYMWLIVVGAVLMRKILRAHDFRESVDLVLADRHYRPLFGVTSRSTTLVVFFGLLHAGYIAYTAATWGEYAGLIALGVAVCLSFFLTWAAVRADLGAQVRAAVQSLEKSYRSTRDKLATMPDIQGIEDDIQRVQMQLKMQLALQQLDYLVTKFESVGRRELLGLMFRAVSPVGSVLARVIRWGSLLAAIGLSSFAAIQGEQPRERRTRGERTRAEQADNSPRQISPTHVTP